MIDTFDDAVARFISLFYEISSQERQGKGDFYDRLCSWRASSGLSSPTKATVAQAMKNLGYTAGRTKSKRFWIGLQLNDNRNDEARFLSPNSSSLGEASLTVGDEEAVVLSLPKMESNEHGSAPHPAHLLSLRQAGCPEPGARNGHLLAIRFVS